MTPRRRWPWAVVTALLLGVVPSTGASAQPLLLQEATSAKPVPVFEADPVVQPVAAPDATEPDQTRSSTSVVTLVAAGDIACDPGSSLFRAGRGTGEWCRAAAVQKVIHGIDPDVVVPLGDSQYDTGRYRAFRRSYGKSWGQERFRTWAVPGNHEYESSSNARGYYRYFGSHAGPNKLGYYSVMLGSWRLIAINSNCWIAGCAAGTKQYTWLRSLLANKPSKCSIAVMHHPLLSSGPHGDDESHARPLWKLLYRSGVELALVGHDHIYERFAPVDASGARDAATGIREFVVGTGGAQHYGITGVHKLSQVHNTKTFGVLAVQLSAGSYSWRFRHIRGSTFTDAGTDSCHGLPA